MRAIFRSRTLGERMGIILMLILPIIIIGVVLFFIFKPDYTEGLNFELNKDGSGYTVVKYDGDEELVEIPERYQGKPVVAIGEKAFQYKTDLETVRIPGSVKVIESRAFEGCSKLLDVTLQSGTTTIEENAFRYCKYITYINLPDTLTEVQPNAFYGCARIADIKVAEGNGKYHAAGNCLIETATKTLVLGGWQSEIPLDGSVTKIGTSAFEANWMITEIVIPDVITEIGEAAFRDCIAAASITIPTSVVKIDKAAFYGCSGVSSVIYKGTSVQWDKIEIGSKNLSFEGIIRYFDPEDEE